MSIASPKAPGNAVPPKPKGGLYPALLAVQSEAPTLQKTAINPHFKSKFVPLDKVHEVVMPLLNKHGLIWLTLPGHTENGSPVLDYVLAHVESAESVRGSMALLPGKADPQGQGSAITYARRYSLMAVLGLVADEDDDGNAGSAGKARGYHGSTPIVGGEIDLADKAASLPGTTELATKSQLTRLEKAANALGLTRFTAYLTAQGVDKPEELTKDAAESVLTWARNQAKKQVPA